MISHAPCAMIAESDAANKDQAPRQKVKASVARERGRVSIKIDTMRRRDPRGKDRDRGEPHPGEEARSLDMWKRMAAARHALSTDAAARRQMEQDPEGFLKKYGLKELPAAAPAAPARIDVIDVKDVEGPGAGEEGATPEAGLRHVAAVWVAVVAHGAERP